MNAAVRDAVGRLCGSTVATVARVSGGDINEAYRALLSDGRSMFVKTHAAGNPRMFECEARGLEWLSEAQALRVPDVIGVGALDDDSGCARGFLVLEYIAAGSRAADFALALGRGVATLHRAGAEHFGLPYDNFIGTLPQDNRTCPTWPAFYLTRRLEPQVRRAVDGRAAPRAWVGRLDRLGARLDEWLGDPEPPARLHGDLWSGNVHVDDSGAPCLIDPAVYGGHREVDLAMLALFGSPEPAFWAGYDDVYPRGADVDERMPLYQLYPLLVHVNLFGGNYVRAVDDVFARFA